MSLGRTSTLDIRTPEGVTFSLPLAGPVPRALAALVDQLIIFAISSAILSLTPLFALISTDVTLALTMLVIFAVNTGAGMLQEWLMGGRTIGKKMLRLRVMDERGLALSFNQIVIRNLLRAIDSPMPTFILPGGLSVLLTRHAQRLGDLAAGTVVVRVPSRREPKVDELLAGQFNSFTAHPLIEARLRQRTTPEEVRLCLGALMRRGELEPENRLRLYHDLADYFKRLAPFPEETTIGLTDEQYLRNTVDTLYRRRAV